MNGSRRHLLAASVGVGLIALVWLAPDIGPNRTAANGTVEAYRGRIESIAFPSPGANADQPPVPIAHVRILDGPHSNELVDAYLAGPGGTQDTSTYAAGQEVVVTFTVQADSPAPYIEVSDHWRIPQLGLLGLLFAVCVVFVGGWHGVRALIALGLTGAVILKVFIPAIIAGVPPVPLAIGVASAVTIVTILLTEGWSWTSLAAILGTTSALAITALLAAVATAFLGFTYAAGSDLAFLTVPGGAGLDLRGVLLAAIILGAVGVLDDVTVTQAVLVEELAAKGGLQGPELVVSAMRIGRSHIGATVNTLFLAYVSVGLPLLILLFVSQRPTGAILNDETFATEIVRTLIGSLGIVAAIPMTTFIAGLLLTGPIDDHHGWQVDRGHNASRAIVTAAGIGALLLATTILSLGGSPRAALTSNVFVPSPAAGSGPPGSGDLASTAPSAGPPSSPGASDGPALYDAGEVIPITVGGVSVGTVVVEPHRAKATPPARGSHVSAVLHFVATGTFPLSAGHWELLLGDGSLVPLVPDDPNAMERTLQSGETADIQTSADLAAVPTDLFAVYVDPASSDIILAVSVP
jgi:uncharacterized membrane protein